MWQRRGRARPVRAKVDRLVRNRGPDRWLESTRARVAELPRGERHRDVDKAAMTADPAEAVDLAGDRPERAAELAALLDRLLDEAVAALPPANPDFDPEARPERGRRRAGR